MGNAKDESTEFSSLKVLRNVPFECIPQAFVENLKGRVYDYDQFLQACRIYNESGVYWNLIVHDEVGNPIAVVWGMWDPLEAHFRVIRVSSHPKWQKAGGKFMRWLFTQVKLFASEMRAEKLYWESNRWKIWLKQLDGLVFIDETSVIQAY